MECELVREALSARLDGQDLPPGVDGTRLDSHVSVCGSCREWLVQVEAVGAQWRFRPAPAVPDLTGRVLDAVGVGGVSVRWRLGRLVVRIALMVVAAAELAVTVPVLVLGHDREAPLHVAHETGSFGLAVAVGVLVATIRPRLAAGMAWLVTAAAGSLVVTAALDLGRGLTTWSDEAPHLVVVAAAVLLWAMTRLEPRGAESVSEPAGGGLGSAPARHPLRLLYRGRATTAGPVLARQQRRAS